MQKLVKHVSVSEREIEKERGKYVHLCCAHAILERRVRNEHGRQSGRLVAWSLESGETPLTNSRSIGRGTIYMLIYMRLITMSDGLQYTVTPGGRCPAD